ncbi:MAG: hypothetical protein JWQ27_1589 [Ferruginibacter sp.]|nr:hypothetical protein [Ferruginibacter sp.]
MLEELFNLVKSVAGNSVINNNDVPNEHNDAVVAEATNTVASGLRNVVAGGGLQNILSMFGGNNNNKQGLLNNPIVSMMIGHFAGKLMNKFNMNNSQANNVAGSLIPDVLGNLVNKVNDPNESGFSLDSLLASITGGKSNEVVEEQRNSSGQSGLNLQDILGQLGGNSGGSSDGNSGGGLMDIIGKLAGGAQQQQQRNGGGLLDLIKGFVK